MNKTLIANHNSVVTPQDVVYHLGDFCFRNKPDKYLKQLNGSNVLLKGSHDKYKAPMIRHVKVEGQYIALCHWAMRTWHRSGYGSWQLFGHWHGKDFGYDKEKQWDVGVDCNGFVPVSFEQLKERLK